MAARRLNGSSCVSRIARPPNQKGFPPLGKTSMTKTIGVFSYRIFAPKKGDYSFNAIVHIVPKTYWTAKDGLPILSPQLMTEQEIDWHVQALKEDLDHVGRLAKRALKHANERTLKNLSIEEEKKDR